MHEKALWIAISSTRLKLLLKFGIFNVYTYYTRNDIKTKSITIISIELIKIIEYKKNDEFIHITKTKLYKINLQNITN